MTPLVGALSGLDVEDARARADDPTYTTKPTYYTEAIKEYLLNRATFLGDEQQRANLLYRGGLQIHATFDPNLQALAEEARTQLPENAQGFDAAMVTLDTKTGAIRAMVGGHGFQPRVDEINMALVPRQTGSSIKLFILAAALQAGALPTDVIDGTKPCTLPNPDDPKNPFLINDAVGRGVVALAGADVGIDQLRIRQRLSQIVGLHRVVDTTYRMAHSPYLFEGQTDRVPIQPYASFATGANAMRPIDMAAGMQTIANQGLHHDPYYVDYIDKRRRHAVVHARRSGRAGARPRRCAHEPSPR